MATDADAPGLPCPDEDQISAYVGGELDADVHAVIEAHLDGCEACSQLVAELVRIFSDDSVRRPVSIERSMVSDGSLTRSGGAPAEPRDNLDLLAPGSAIGRYRTLECVGIGGMGVVYAAYDPQLDRRVALKLLLDVGGEDGTRKRARLLREAQSMAKLTHVNVITVHDVGTWHGQVFVAMEFVEGGTLKSWMREKRRSWKEVRVTMLAAGRGLAAAHAAGLVHRDFKPDNVLIGRDGRVRVTDFGLARWEDGAVSTGQSLLSASGEPSASRDESEDVLSVEVSLTRTGALVGTPAYMAPELYSHEVADAATDQFAFCVALYEALYGARPFRGQTLAELATNVISADNIEFSGAVDVPRHIRKALRRGLSRRRLDRFPSMDALLAALDRRVVRRWRQAAFVGLPLATLGLGAWASWRRESAEVSCQSAKDPFVAVWNPGRRQRISEAFSRADSRLAGQAAQALVQSVDAYAEAWGAAAVLTCETDAVGGEGTYVELARRCLAQRRIALDVALQDFDEVDDEDVARARGLVASIARDCTDEAALLSRAPPPAPEELRGDVERVRLELAKLEGYLASGDYDAGVQLAKTLDARAVEIGHAPLQAEARLELGRLLDLAGDVEGAAAALEEAELLATASRFHRITAETLVLAVYVRGVILQQHDEARRLARRADAARQAAGLGDEFRTALLMNQASMEFSAGEYATAEVYAAEALGFRDREANALLWADAAYNLATIRMIQGRHAEAIDTLRAYITTFEAEVGHRHPDVSVGYHSLGVALLATGKTDEGERALRTSLEILERTLGDEHPLYANPLSDLSVFEAEQSNYVAAIELARKALSVREAHGTQPLLAAVNRLHVAQWLAELDRFDEAWTELEQAEEDAVGAVGAEHPRIAEFHVVRASLNAVTGQREAAELAMQRARVLIESDPDLLWNHRLIWAKQLGTLGEEEEAMSEVRTLLAEAAEERPKQQRAEARFVLAGFVDAKTPGSPEARVLAQTALRGFEASSQPAEADKVRVWLAEH